MSSDALIATYRLQLRPGFGFDQATEVLPYLAELGVSHVYFSPYLQAAPGSTHGYDVVDHGAVNEELGGEEAHARMCAALRALGLRQVVDVVPNHMSINSSRNRWWWDVLENGPSSRFATFFDVDWSPLDQRLQNQVLLPILGDHYGRVLEQRMIRVRRDGGRFIVHAYDEHQMPASPTSLGPVLEEAGQACASDDLLFLADVLCMLPSPASTDPESVARRARDLRVVARQLQRLVQERSDVAAAVDAVLAKINADPDAMDRFLEAQNYRLAYWKTARHDLDYRRFFDINSLVAVRIEREDVFEATHARIIEWLQRGVVHGLRIDHPDGLVDPEGYFRRLREASPDGWIVVEKILEADEELPGRWPVDGTTGYEFAGLATGLFIDARNETAWTRAYEDYVQEPLAFETIVVERKRRVLERILASDLSRLTTAFQAVCEANRSYRDHVRTELRRALIEVLVHFGVYRSYVRAGESASASDRAHIERAVAAARASVAPDLLDFLSSILTADVDGPPETELRSRFQQLSSAVMAKGQEDTSFFVYNRMLALNDVGHDPSRFGVSLELFHSRMQRAQARAPRAMVTTSTHDAKRSEDVRARLAVLSEMPQQWSSTVGRWRAMLAEHLSPKLDRNTEWYVFQTLVGAWPISFERAWEHVHKAIREAKERTSWTEPDAAYEAAVERFVSAATRAPFSAELDAFTAEILPHGRRNSLAQLVLRLTVPGVPDTYQGCELFQDVLTDPDNRGLVDFAHRRSLLETVRTNGPGAHTDDGAKLFILDRLLSLRRARPGWFDRSSRYLPVRVDGEGAHNTIAYQRGEAIVVVPRLLLTDPRALHEAALELGRPMRDVLSSARHDAGTLRVADMGELPIGVLVPEDDFPFGSDSC